MNDDDVQCPICNGNYHRIADCMFVCERHSSWIVTVCERCKQISLSDFAGGCPDCFGLGEDDNYATEHLS
jgi:hypothetical protein